MYRLDMGAGNLDILHDVRKVRGELQKLHTTPVIYHNRVVKVAKAATTSRV